MATDNYKSPAEKYNESLQAQQQKGFMETGDLVWREKTGLEFSRYKQDCRKKAFDVTFRNFDPSTSTESTMAVELKNAELLYTWLISIPELK